MANNTDQAAFLDPMSEQKLAVVVLAAGQGTRMKSDIPKVLHRLAGKTLLDHVLDRVTSLSPERVIVVVGPEMDQTRVAPQKAVVQSERKGTGHAVACAKDLLKGYLGSSGEGDVLVVYGDTPFLTRETLEGMLAARREKGAPDILGLAFRPENPGEYGRVLLDDAGRVARIVEYVDASPEEREVGLCNAGIVLGKAARLFELIARLDDNNAKGEFYLTDIYAIAAADGRPAGFAEADATELLGVNSRAELAGAEAILQARLREQAMAGGATLIDPGSVWFCWDTELGRDVVIQPHVFFGPGVKVGNQVEIHAFCHIAESEIADGVTVGPFARLRGGARLETGARIGNFVEMKNAVLGAGAKAMHLTYLGDAEIGAKANIGAGTITCNYDGLHKHKTSIGAGAFVGSNSALVAPLEIGAGSIVGAGSTVTQDVAADSLAIARGKQIAIPEGATKYRAGKSGGKQDAKDE